MNDDLAVAQQQDDEKQAKLENAAIASLKDAERAWVSYRDVRCKAAADYDVGRVSPMICSRCLRTLTEHRIADLKSIYEGRGRKLGTPSILLQRVNECNRCYRQLTIGST